jgi:RND superfamily putative drug exporter
MRPARRGAEVAPGEEVAEMTATDLDRAGSREAAGRPGRLYRWGLLVTRRRRVVFAVWAVLIAAGLAFVPGFMSSLSMGAGIWVPGSESSRAAALLARDLPATGGNQAVLVFSSRMLTAADPGFRRVVTAAGRDVSAVRGVSGVTLPVGAAAADLVAAGGHTAIAVVALRGDEQQAQDAAGLLTTAAAKAATGPVRVGVTGEPVVDMDAMSVEDADLARADAAGLPVALLVLLVMFGSLVAAGLPLLLALSTVGITFGGFGAYLALAGGSFNSVMESVVVLLGLGIGIDYALFVVTRFREGLAGGTAPGTAAAAATATAGRTVLVSGATVIAALAPLLLINDTMMREVAIGPMVAIAVLVAAALSLLPATLAALGPRVSRLAPPLPRWLRWSRQQPQGASRLTALVLRRPAAVLACGVVVLGALAAFTLQLHTGFDYGLNSIASKPSGRADAAITAAFGPGAISPVQVVFTTGGRPLSARDLQAIARFETRLGRDPRVRSVTSLPAMLGGPAAAARTLAAARTDPSLAALLSPIVNVRGGGTLTVMTITPRTAFDSAQAAQLVASLRAELPPALRGTGMRALAGGATADLTDLTNEINSKTPLVLTVIVAVALLLLAAAYRSPLVALTGLAGTLLSVGAAYGLVVLVFQKGGGQSVLGFHSPGFTQDYLPLVLFAILVGLSTDYQVFLISRVKEEWERSHDAARAVAVGLQRSGRVILSAATIMITVFASFLLATALDLKELGFALAVVVLIDAALTRRLLVPAALRLLGSRAWARPGLPRARRPAGRRP